MIDNSLAVAEFLPVVDDGDTFIYTEMLDRSKNKGNNGVRLLKTFYHRSASEFWTQWPTIKHLCELGSVRACTRLAPRSFAKVGATFARLVVDAALTANWVGMKSLYNRACGTTAPIEKRWLFDVDRIGDRSNAFAKALALEGHLIARIPSKKGEHLITRAFNVNLLVGGVHVDGAGFVYNDADDEDDPPRTIQLHKDNPTNLYIPDGAA